MDQPTYLELHITGTEQNVAQAANFAARIINQNSPREYFEYRVKNMLENNLKNTIDSEVVEFSLNTESYWAIYEEDISQIANAIIQASSDVKFHLFARITMTYCEGYDTCVDINYASGKITIDVSYDEYDAEEKDQIRKILDAIGEEHAKELADEMLNELFEEEWTMLHDSDIQEAFFDAALNYADDIDDFISEMTEKVYELFDIVIDDDDWDEDGDEDDEE